jgi:hypothetical protein
VNVKAGKIHGLKSHDYHIIMQRLLPIMLRGYLDDDIWEALAELSYFYRQLDEVQYHGYHVSWTRPKGTGGLTISQPLSQRTRTRRPITEVLRI